MSGGWVMEEGSVWVIMGGVTGSYVLEEGRSKSHLSAIGGEGLGRKLGGTMAYFALLSCIYMD